MPAQSVRQYWLIHQIPGLPRNRIQSRILLTRRGSSRCRLIRHGSTRSRCPIGSRLHSCICRCRHSCFCICRSTLPVETLMPRAASIAAGPVAFSTGGPDGRIIVSPCASRCKSWRCSGTFPARCSATRLFCTPVCRTSSSVRSKRHINHQLFGSDCLVQMLRQWFHSHSLKKSSTLRGCSLRGHCSYSRESEGESSLHSRQSMSLRNIQQKTFPRGNTLISFATQGLKQSLALHSVHATHLHSLGNQSATLRQIGNFGTIPSGQKTFGESILSHSQLSLSLVLGFSGNIENIAHAAMTRQVNIAHAVMTRSCCIPFTLHKTAV